MIRCGNPRAQYLSYKDEIDSAVLNVLDKGQYILGEEVRRFEEEFASYIGVGHAVGVGSGTDALHLALRASGVGPGDEVITVSHTAVATVAAIEMAGATAVLVDIDRNTLTLAPCALQAAIGPRTKAIIPVHLYGHPADLDAILEIANQNGLTVIEDCAQAHGARYRGRRVGGLADLGCFSFYPTKNLGGIGDGGVVTTNDPELAQRLTMLREYGWVDRYVSSYCGWNSRLDELQAAILRIKLRYLDQDNNARRAWAAMYSHRLADCDLRLPSCLPETEPVYHLYVVRSEHRAEIRKFLKTKGIETGIHYPVPIHQQPAYSGRLRSVGTLANSEWAAREVLSLPMYAELTQSEIESVIQAIREYFAVN